MFTAWLDNGSLNEQTNECTSERLHEQTNECTSERLHEQTDEA